MARRMTYCLGIVTKDGLVMAADSRTNAGSDQVRQTRKLFTFGTDGERAFFVAVSGSLSGTQSVMTLLDREFALGKGLAEAPTMYDAARHVGKIVRDVSTLDRASLEQDGFSFNPHFLLGGQIKGEPTQLYLVYPQGNPLRATEESPFLQIGEAKYGRPILDRGIRYGQTSLVDAARYALISLDSTMKSNATVGPPIDLAMYVDGELHGKRRRRFSPDDPLLNDIRLRWDRALREAVQGLPVINLQAGEQ